MKPKTIIFLSVTLFYGSCAEKMEKSEIASSTEAADAKTQIATLPQSDLYSDGKTKLIKTAEYRFEVANVKKSTEAITASVRKFPAYISSSSLHLENPVLENKMTIRVQNEFFQDLLKDIDGEAKFVNYRNVETQDASKEFVDLESRLKTKREVEQRYMEILRSKAGTIEELLHAEEQIGQLHEEIEATIARINHLREQVSYSTINLEFYQTISQELVAGEGSPATGREFQKALHAGWNGVIVIIITLMYVWPLIVVSVVIFLFVRYRMARKKISTT